MAEKQMGEQFKPAKRGGYDREDVEYQFQTLKNASAMERDSLLAQIEEKEKEIASLNETIREQQEEIDSLHKDIDEKYKDIVDSYDTIGQVILDSRLQAKKILDEADAAKAKIIAGANAEVEKAKQEGWKSIVADALEEKASIEKETEIKRKQYEAVCAKLAGMLDRVDSVQARFGNAVYELHAIAEEHPAQIQPAAEELLEEEEPAEAFDIEDTHEIDFREFSGVE